METRDYDINKEAFGAFVAVRRKGKGYTQKELADRLFVSDKAVSKWERGLSLPDISLLVPLADALGVTVMELLEGRKLENAEPENMQLGLEQVEQLVKKAVSFSEESYEVKKARREKNAPVFIKLVLISAAEVIAGIGIIYALLKNGMNPLYINSFIGPMMMGLMGFIFGIYFWLFMKDRLPAYYDENKISAYSDGVFRMNMPGMYFNNNNWPYITKVLKQWDAVTMLTAPALCIITALLIKNYIVAQVVLWVMTMLCMAGLFVSVYVVGRRYDG